jgi:hypothetical protein
MKFHSIPAWLAVLPMLGLCILFTGCSHGFDEDAMRVLAEQNPIALDSEQVTLTDGQLSCGIINDLWEEVPSDGGQRAIYRLTQKGRDLQFSDDIYARDPEFNGAYTQLRGKFFLSLAAVVAAHDGPDQGTKLVQATLGVKIPHACFADPLPIMGINKGKFTTKLAPTLLYENGDKGWLAIKLMH